MFGGTNRPELWNCVGQPSITAPPVTWSICTPSDLEYPDQCFPFELAAHRS
ncbi:hypothetical protein Sjap_025914 [Stephania japonica]|uniref:Uncharacterized protein n=1 Tax=Stephania japonica TaxID=461633 RepID=A0AAP0E5Q3_9MAGN